MAHQPRRFGRVPTATAPAQFVCVSFAACACCVPVPCSGHEENVSICVCEAVFQKHSRVCFGWNVHTREIRALNDDDELLRWPKRKFCFSRSFFGLFKTGNGSLSWTVWEHAERTKLVHRCENVAHLIQICFYWKTSAPSTSDWLSMEESQPECVSL